jgi:hypothetical protein
MFIKYNQIINEKINIKNLSIENKLPFQLQNISNKSKNVDNRCKKSGNNNNNKEMTMKKDNKLINN